MSDVDELEAGVRDGDRRALARAITLVESTRADHREAAVELLDRLVDRTGGATRVGISGSPGVGKSTFIEALGLEILRGGHRLAVLAVDPSSRRSGGSILGDKTRMVELGREPDAYIRPSPAGETLGGVARRTREALLLCEAAGFDVVLVETVGVGQSETAVAELVDVFTLLVAPGGGDDLQGIKRGIMELADVVVVNKADGDLEQTAGRTAADYRNALGLMRPRVAGIEPKVLTASALKGHGIDETWAALCHVHDQLSGSGALDDLRRGQAVAWMWSEVQDAVIDAARRDGHAADRASRIEDEVADGRRTPTSGAREILRLMVR
ncbi:methylmalonyl Co-A mutase-associated GTPase MeaB [Actinomarinicola tropica]|uniref:Methylmalonyl Co-A mutase-associated GTPase MeaB n=1 Tax=Actinomarinicola tropica TaxID=2789776 RepID=A0A5Q2RP11_9ACTN|nr:methylmalonyl Co-A mutase-associated GTPase MeaB [Actinomarinicola tropica]QGG95837.1 methylmalonyl Co-A mutase-associated GTPase MeaB [Actinomarinicola tropica]